MSQLSCLDCYRKHIATSMAFEDEASIGEGYPDHKWLAIGELNAASKEVINKYPILAEITREHCLQYQVNNISIPTLLLIKLATEIEKGEEKYDKSDSTS